MNNLTKADIGKTFWFVPTANNVARNGTSPFEQAIEVKITSMARVKGTFVAVKSDYEEDFKLCGAVDWTVRQGDNAGYEIYKSKSEIEDAMRATAIQNYLRENINTLSIDSCLKIGQALGIETQGLKVTTGQ